jgi:hypothetical protein
LPRFPEYIFDLGEDSDIQQEPQSRSYAFKLGLGLKSFPNQENHGIIEFEEISLQDLVHDDDVYYCKISRKGLLHHITRHFSQITEDGNEISVYTDIGTFVFRFINNKTFVRVNTADRTLKSRYPPGQDMEHLHNNASGRWRRFIYEPTTIRIVEGAFNHPRGVGPWQWTEKMPIDTALLCQDLDPPQCIRFMTSEDYAQLKLFQEFADNLLAALSVLAEYRSDVFGQAHLAVPIKLANRLRQSLPSGPREANLFVTGGSGILDAAVRGPQNDSALVTPESKMTLLRRSSDIWDELLGIYKPQRRRIDIQTRLERLCDTDSSILGGLMCLALLVRLNSHLVLQWAVESPRRWHTMLTLSDADVLIE